MRSSATSYRKWSHGCRRRAIIAIQPAFPSIQYRFAQTALFAHQIQYVFLGEELGARRTEPECYVDGVAKYELIASTDAFARAFTDFGLALRHTGLHFSVRKRIH